MKIYFGDASKDTFGSDGLLCGKDSNFYYGVEHGTGPGGMDEVRIFDGCNRYVPIDLGSLPELIAALQEVQTVSDDIKQAEIQIARSESNAEGVVTRTWGSSFNVDFDQE